MFTLRPSHFIPVTMQCLIVYDIPDDRKRAKVADACMDYGLDRIQYSAFLGPLLPVHREELMRKIKKTLGRRPGNVQLFPICESDWAERLAVINHVGEVATTSEAGDDD